MKLVLFDVDGTLVNSHRFDADCYVRAVEDVLGVKDVDDDWSHYKHVTDQGVLAEIYRENFGREIGGETVERFKAEFMSTMRRRLEEAGEGLEPVPGAIEAFGAARSDKDLAAAVTTGCWRVSALFKLASAGFEIGNVPVFSSDDAVSREGIMRKALADATREETSPDKVVYIGDGVWDLAASRRMGFDFIAIGEGWKELEARGAAKAFPDFTGLEAFLKALRAP